MKGYIAIEKQSYKTINRFCKDKKMYENHSSTMLYYDKELLKKILGESLKYYKIYEIDVSNLKDKI